MNEIGKKYAVISGDIIDSGKLKPLIREALFKKLESYLITLEKMHKGSFQGESNQGDWFQLLIHHPSQSLKYLMLMKTWMRAFLVENNISVKQSGVSIIDARMSIGIGEIEFLSRRLGGSDGPAFRISGRLLEVNKKTSRTIVGQVESDEKLNEELEVLLQMLDFILSKSTALQCQVIHRKLLGKKEVEIAEELDILQSAVNQRSTAAGWNVIESALKRFEKIIDLRS